jgi:hypothetical protein
VAGKFYTAHAAQLRKEIEQYLADAEQRDLSSRVIISPHAGYVFSGPVAAEAYRAIDRSVETVILIGPSHHHYFNGVSIPEVDYYETPLGAIPLASDIIEQLRKEKAVTAEPSAHKLEHCLEVQLPFCQVVLDSFRIVPIITGKVSSRAVAELIYPVITQKTLIIASSDLSHFHPHNEAKGIDRRSVETILKGDTDGFIDGCGETGIRAVMHLSKKMGLHPILLDARNSSETAPQFGSEGRVVGYASIVYVERDNTENAETNTKKTTTSTFTVVDFSKQAKRYCLSLARKSITAAVRGETPPVPDDAPEETGAPYGCFVTLTKNGMLRGCIGTIEGVKPFCEAVVDNAKSAALRDPRFPPVSSDEVDKLHIEVSVLTPPSPIEYNSPDDLLRKIEKGKDGIILEKGMHRSTFLPQVWEQIPDKISFLQHLSRKGGMSSDGWKTAEVKRYRVSHFEEE